MDRYILVINANSIKGNELIKRLIAENYIVFATDVNFESNRFGNLIYINMDPTNERSINYAKNVVLKYTSSLEAIINLTNYISFDTLIEGSEEKFKQAIEENFFNVYRPTKILWSLLSQRNGKIINDCSDVTLYSVVPFNGLYHISKSMVDIYSDCLRRELAYKNIKVIKVHSGYIKDKDHEKVMKDYFDTIEESNYFSNEMSKLKEINLNQDSQVDIKLYSDLIVSILKKNKPKNMYTLKPNKRIKKINSKSISNQDKFFLKIK